jgi:hypothetical protein
MWPINANAKTRSVTVPTATIGTFTYEVNDVNNCLKDVYKITLSSSLSTDEFDENKNALFPNPTSGKITITGDISSYTSYSVKSIEGKAVQEGTLNNNEIDLSSLPVGIYTVKIESKEKSFVKEVIKSE